MKLASTEAALAAAGIMRQPLPVKTTRGAVDQAVVDGRLGAGGGDGDDDGSGDDDGEGAPAGRQTRAAAAEEAERHSAATAAFAAAAEAERKVEEQRTMYEKAQEKARAAGERAWVELQRLQAAEKEAVARRAHAQAAAARARWST